MPGKCPVCGEDGFEDGHERVDHITDEHDGFTKFAEGWRPINA